MDRAKPQGQTLMQHLALHAGVLEYFKVGGLAQCGPGAASPHEANPRLLYRSITGLGQQVPLALSCRAHDVRAREPRCCGHQDVPEGCPQR
jgi:crotonobetainyl-CoA:carnitine CoA-transferase CaiB-like acyl-CoA transferase